MKDRPIWIHGSYGMGKTFASFVVKHILEDSLDEVEKYFTHHEINSLWQRVEGVRSKGKILVVHQSSSAGINSQNKLFNTIIESVKRVLRENGYTYTGAASILEKVLATLKDPNATFNFQAAFKKYRGKFLAYSSPEEIIADLETLEGSERLDLLEDIADVAEKESYNWSMSVQDVIDWLRDVREKNNLYAVFFIWDEFTEYFRNNLNNITGLQEIAQNAAELSFYFFLITHSDANQLITDPIQRKIIEARFKISHITLAESTAFQLMAQALMIDSDLKEEWKKISLELWENVQREAVIFIIKRDESIKLDDMKKLLPIHPYAAYLLKFIVQSISSNQRTMFQFLCAAGDGTFKNFIDSHGFEYGGDNFLTTDSLWNYFFQEDNPDLDKTFLDAMGHYNNFAPACKNDNQRRILKATLILFALQQKNLGGRGGATSLLRSTQKNICACFAGTPIENEVRPTLNYFTYRGIVSALEEGNDTNYILATTQIDPDRMEKYAKNFQNAVLSLTFPARFLRKLSEASRVLGEKLNKIRIPRAVVEEIQPNLKPLLQIFATLRNDTEKNFVQVTEQINRSAQMFKNFFENQFEFFTKALTEYVDGTIDSKLVEKLFNDAPAGIFFKTRDDFILQMKSRLKKFRQDEKTGKFFGTWHEVTGTLSPADWSNQNEILILCMFQDCLDEAQACFSALNQKSQLANETAIDAAIKFIRSDFASCR